MSAPEKGSTNRGRGHRKWKRRRAHLLPVFHRTLHRYSWERAMRRETAGRWLDWTEDKVLGVVAMACIGVLMLILAAIAGCFHHCFR